MKTCLLLLFALTFVSEAFSSESTESIKFRVELSPVWQTVNSIQIPTPGGTRFDLTNLGQGPAWNYRFDASWKLGDNHEIRGLYAPLSLTVSGRLGADVSFQNSIFPGAGDTEGFYRFNSYRLTYRYRIVRDSNFLLWVGFTGKIRDAEIRLTQGSTSASRTNVGFVPLLHVLSSYKFSDSIRTILEIDALAAPQGRAEDIGLLLAIRMFPQVEGFVGYRTVEGGSDGGGSVYNFTWLHYGVLGLGVTL